MEQKELVFKKLDIFRNRLKNIGIEVELGANWPWIYLMKIQNKKVTEVFQAEWGFTVAMLSIRGEIKFTDTKEIFKLIRKYR